MRQKSINKDLSFSLVVLFLLGCSMIFAAPSYAFSGKIGTFFFHWYRCPDNPDPDLHSPGANACDVSNLKIKNIAPGMKIDDPYPEGGYYHWGNLNWYKREFSDMVNTGFDYAFVVDLYQSSQIVTMGQAITQLNLPLKLGFFWDPPAEIPGQFDLSKTADIEKLYRDYIYPFYNSLPRELWAMHNNRPIILTVYTEQEANLQKAREMFLYFKDRFKDDFGMEPWFIVDASWWFNSDLNGVADAKYTWGGTVNIKNDTVNGFKVTNLGPGVDMHNTPWGGLTAPYVDRRGGNHFRDLLSLVPNDSNLLMIETWNELFENTGISRAINYSDSNGNLLPQDYYMNILRTYLGLTTPARNAEVKFLNVPTSVNVGEDFSVSVEVKNTGLTYWSEKDTYRLGTQDPQDNLIWGKGRILLLNNEVVFPNSSKVFIFNLKAPDTIGSKTLSLKMVHDGVEWFGGKATTNINVQARSVPMTLSLTTRLGGVSVSGVTKTFRIAFQTGLLQWSYDFTATSGNNGVFSVSDLPLTGLEPGSYGVYIKDIDSDNSPSNHLRKSFGNIILTGGQNVAPLSWGTDPQYFLKPGDVNGDNRITIEDVTAILSVYTAISVPVDISNKIYDINNDSVLNIGDVSLVLGQYIQLVVSGD